MITKNYIKQCEKAKDIQKAWKPEDGDYFYGYEWNDSDKWKSRDLESKNISELATKEIHLLYFSGDDFNSCFPMGEEIGQGKNEPDLTKAFWLPTQEQLQEMILPTLKKKYNKYWDLNKMERIANWVFRIFNCFLNEHSDIYSNDMNGLWLAFVMKEKYNKVWSNGKWIKGGLNDKDRL